MTAKTAQGYFAEKTDPMPKGIKKMTVRRHYEKRYGPWLVRIQSSCGWMKPHIAGSVKLSLYDARCVEGKGPMIKRFAVDNWDEAMYETEVLFDMLTSPVNKHIRLEDLRS